MVKKGGRGIKGQAGQMTSPSGIGHDEARRVLALAQGVAVDGFWIAAQETGSGPNGREAADLAPRVLNLNRALGCGCRGALGGVGPVPTGVYETQITNPVVRPVPVYVVYQERTWVSPVMQVPGHPVSQEAASA
jgi:hypothetical protein